MGQGKMNNFGFLLWNMINPATQQNYHPKLDLARGKVLMGKPWELATPIDTLWR